MKERNRGEDHPRRDDPAEQHASGFTDATHGKRDVSDSEILAHEEAMPQPGQRDFEPDVERIHRPIFREPRDPLEGREPAPWWLWTIAALSLFWGGWYLGRRGGDFNIETHVAYPELQEEIRAAAAREQTAALANPVQLGQTIYAARCQSCHQPNGRGAPGVFPPLVGSEYVTGEPAMPVLIVLHGLQGPITVAGVAYNGAMPAWQALLSDAEIAAVVTFIRQWNGNRASAVSVDLVKKLRAATADRTTPWTAPELRAALQRPEVRGAAGAQDSVTQVAR